MAAQTYQQSQGNSAMPQYSTRVTAKGPGLLAWINPHDWEDFIMTLAGDIASVLNPVLKPVFRDIAAGIEIAGNLWSDFRRISSAITNGRDIGTQLGVVTSIIWDIVNSVLNKADSWQKFLIGVGLAGTGAVDAVSDGEFSVSTFIGSIAQLGWDIDSFFYTQSAQYYSTYPNG